MPIQFSIFTGEDGSSAVSVFADGQLLSADDSHPNFTNIVAACETAKTDHSITGGDVIPLFDIAETVAVKFQRLSERVAVKNGVITLDGDPVHGVLQDQILNFVEAGEDFDPLVKFYERLTTNPLGDVREGLFQWINGKEGDVDAGKVTITPEGKLLGYKSVLRAKPEWRTDLNEVFVPSQRSSKTGDLVNGVEVVAGKFIEQVPGDIVEMPRSIVLHDPSSQCGVGLHIGTFAYASGFYGGNTVMLVEFDPRDIVSLPDSNSSWKLRVCRYKVISEVTEPLDSPVYATVTVTNDPSDTVTVVPEVELEPEAPTYTSVPDFPIGTKVKVDGTFDGGDYEGTDGENYVSRGSVGTVTDNSGMYLRVTFPGGPDTDWAYCPDEVEVVTDDPQELDVSLSDEEPQVGDTIQDEEGDVGVVTRERDEDGDIEVDFAGNTSGTGFDGTTYVEADTATVVKRNGYSGPTSQAAKGRGRNPAQDDKGRFSGGRPGSRRDASTGRFA